MWLMEIIKLSGQKWSVLTRQRRVDVIVGLILHCLLMAMYVLLVIIKRVVLAITFSIYTCVVRTATLLGLIRPVRLVGDVSRASHEGFACSSVQARSLECRKAKEKCPSTARECDAHAWCRLQPGPLRRSQPVTSRTPKNKNQT
ncbi:uncharacterized protein LOC112561848 isoform X1 [Pomacea canaliculata]|uniref:uncharacterized protein LOC112561848 isoform X1 n=1 Tax=Pomacea canaliculata TaxID=400727 RepID=UPI000D729704|nr:uncharacterized protein LOC112561848 isoform X1 [Pomacea canaliculata]